MTKLSLLNQKIVYSNCRSLPIANYSCVPSDEPERRRWEHKGKDELMFGSYIGGSGANCKIRVEFEDGTFVYVTKKS